MRRMSTRELAALTRKGRAAYEGETFVQGHTGKRRYLTEDWWFCQSWIDCGGKVFGDARVVLQHIGQITFPLKSQLPAPVIPTVEDVKAPA